MDWTDWTQWTPFAILAAAVITLSMAFRRARQGMRPPLPAQLWLQDCTIGTLAFGIYVSAFQVVKDGNAQISDWIMTAPFSGAVLTIAALLCGVEICRDWAPLRRPAFRGLAVGLICACFLTFGGAAILAWWMVRTLVSLFRSRAEEFDKAPIDTIRIAAGWFLACAIVYAVSFPLPTGINVGITTRQELYGWHAYGTSFEGNDRGTPLQASLFTKMNIFNLVSMLWTANVFFWLGTAQFLEGRFGLAAINSVLAIMLGLSLYIDPPDEVLRFSPAYHVWLGAMAILIIGSAVEFVRAKKRVRSTARRIAEQVPQTVRPPAIATEEIKMK